MTKLHLFIVLVCALLNTTATPARAQLYEAVRNFEEGNQLYAHGAYQDALEAYQRALEGDYEGGALYYNMGNAYYRLDELGQAILHYEKARRFIPNDPQLLHNLDIAHARIDASFSTLPTPIWVTWWKQYVVRTGPLVFFIAGLLFYGIAAALFGHRIWTGTRNPWHRRILSASLAVGVVLLAVAFTVALDPTLERQAVLIADQTTLRTAPQPDAAAELDIHEGVLLDVRGQQDNWLEVSLPNGVSGWIEADTAADI